MRVSVLLMMLLAGAAHAAPATPELADRWLDAMQRGFTSQTLMAEFDPMQQQLRQAPALRGIDDAKLGCVRWLLQDMAYQGMRERVIERLGDTGEQDMQAWLAFLDTTGGEVMKANLARADARDITAITARLSKDEQSAALAFLGSPVAERGMRAIEFNEPLPMPQGFGPRLASECGIQLNTPEMQATLY